MRELLQIHFKKQQDFRDWLIEKHNSSPGIWMIFYKKHTAIENISYDDALNEALCFGWIDSTIRKIDDAKYVRMFTPRTNTKNWSDVNKLKVIELLKTRQMTDAGLQKIDEYVQTGTISWKASELKRKRNRKMQAPEFILKELGSNEPALQNFLQLAPSYQKQFIGWITSAKKEETIDKRITEVIELLKEGKKLGMK